MADFGKITHTVRRLGRALDFHLKLNSLGRVRQGPPSGGTLGGRVWRVWGLALGSHLAKLSQGLR